MLRIEVSEEGQGPLPAIDLDDPIVVIGSDPAARIRLPADAALAEHIRLEAGRWRALGPVRLRSAPVADAGTVVGRGASLVREHPAGDSGDIGSGVTIELGAYRIHIAPAPAGSVAATPQRTESLARELMRSLLGGDAAPSLTIERGPHVGATRKLAPPQSVTVIGRGDDANWIIVDNDLSRLHAEVRRGWDGTRLVDLGSKNGSKVDGTPVTPHGDGVMLRDNALVELGPLAFRFHDPADRQLAATPGTLVAAPAAIRASSSKGHATLARVPRSPGDPAARTPAAARASVVPFYAAVTIMVVALAGLVWILSV